MSDHATINAAESIKQILLILEVRKVVCVDDIYLDAPSVEEVIAAAKGMTTQAVLKAIPEIGHVNIDDLDVRTSRLREIWPGLSAEVQLQRATEIVPQSPTSATDQEDLSYAAELAKLVPSEMLTTLSPRQWSEQKAHLLEEAPDNNTLFLFDQVIKDGDSDAGMKIIATLLAQGAPPLCGLLTHSVTPQNQLIEWERLSKQYGINRDKFMLIPKQWLQKNPIVFAQILKFAALSPDFTLLKQMTQEIITAAAIAVASKVEEINIYNLDHIVLRVSANEGLWEPDMLFRLYALFHRLESRRLAQQQPELERVAAKLRSVSLIPTLNADFPQPNTHDLQRLELYESGEYLNRSHLPIELGDIFEKIGTEKYFILLAQPCDLMVRADGQRQPDLDYVALVPAYKGESKPLTEELLHFSIEATQEHWFLRLKQAQYVSASAIDSCAFNVDGHAVISLHEQCPNGVRPAWQERFVKLQKLYNQMAKKLRLLESKAGDSSQAKQLKKAMRNDLLRGGPFDGDMVERDGREFIEFDCRRIYRLSRSHAFAKLLAFSSCFSRPAHDVDFG